MMRREPSAKHQALGERDLTWAERETTFKKALRQLDNYAHETWKLADAFSTRTAARVLTDGLLVGTYNLNRIGLNVEHCALSTLLRTLQGDEVFLSFTVGSGLPTARERLAFMAQKGATQQVTVILDDDDDAPPEQQMLYGKSNNYVAVYLADNGHIYLHNNGTFPHEIGDHLSLLDPPIPLDNLYIGVYPPAGTAEPSAGALEAVTRLVGLVGQAKVVHLGPWMAAPSPFRLLPNHPTPTLDQVVWGFQIALDESGLRIPSTLSRSFLASLATKRFAILTGLSGSGKTQIALRLGDWFGKGRSLLVPVRPDWTGPEPLLGYEDGLAQPNKNGQRPSHAPEVLQFILKAAQDQDHPYLLILDEMNLAHVERYFADILSGLESRQGALPNLIEQDGQWWPTTPKKIPLPSNLFIVGTVNVDETTYMFSPKVLDRANTFEFRVETADLDANLERPTPCQPGDEALVRGFLEIARDDGYQKAHPAPQQEAFADHLRTLHNLLAAADWEFGHRVFYEANRFAALLAAAGDDSLESALDAQLMQKILPRLHGNRRRLEPTLMALGRFCLDLTYEPDAVQADRYKELAATVTEPKLPTSLAKIKRMLRNLQANQFASFTE
jgi:MoxR-like ATPase